MNTEFLSEPIFLVVLAGLLSSSFLSINAKKQSGSERSNALVISALAFSLTGILTSAITYAIYNSMISKVTLHSAVPMVLSAVQMLSVTLRLIHC